MKRGSEKKPPPVTLSAMGFNPDVAKALGENVVKGMRQVSDATSRLIESQKLKPEIRAGKERGLESMTEHHRNLRDAEFGPPSPHGSRFRAGRG
jgi:hypothetical protein